MFLLPPFVSTHHQNVAFFFFIIILLVQSIGGAPFDFSSDESSSDGERRPIQPRPIFNRSMSCQTHSGPLFLGRPVKMNDKKALEWKPLLSSNNSRPPSLEDTIKSYEDKMKMRTKAQKIEKLLRDDLKQIQKRPNGLMQLLLKSFPSFKSKNNEKHEKTPSKNAELIDQFLNYKPMENACEELLPTWDPITKKHYNDYELRMKACRNLHALTGWVAVEKAISATGRLNSLQRFMSTKSTGFGSGNGTLKRLTSLQRSVSTKSMDFAFSKSKIQKNFVKEDIICSVQWDVLRTGMLRLSDKNLKERILGKCRRVNYILQLLILQNLLLKTRPKRDINEISIEDQKERKRNQKISENLEVYKQKFKEETAELLNSLDKRSNGQLDEEFNKALVELRDKMVAHWTWLYKQHVC